MGLVGTLYRLCIGVNNRLCNPPAISSLARIPVRILTLVGGPSGATVATSVGGVGVGVYPPLLAASLLSLPPTPVVVVVAVPSPKLCAPASELLPPSLLLEVGN